MAMSFHFCDSQELWVLVSLYVRNKLAAYGIHVQAKQLD